LLTAAEKLLVEKGLLAEQGYFQTSSEISMQISSKMEQLELSKKSRKLLIPQNGNNPKTI